MSFTDRVGVLILTWNEEANLARTLDALRGFARVVVLDSGSTDATLQIAGRYPNVQVQARPFDNHAAQWNHGLALCPPQAEWVLALDADYVLPPDLAREISALSPAPQVGGYRVRFRYCVNGVPLSGSLYPPVTVLYRREGAHYIQDGHTQRVMTGRAVLDLQAKALHDDRKLLAHWLAAQERYAALEAQSLLGRTWAELGLADRIRRLMVITPWLVPLYCLTVGKGLLDGRAGLVYALQRGVAEAILSLKLLEHHMHNAGK